MIQPSKPLRRSLAALALAALVLPFLPFETDAREAFMEDWLYTAEAQARTASGDCPPGEVCLELCLVNPQNGNIITQDHFECFPAP